MAIAIEGYSVVGRVARMEEHPGGIEGLLEDIAPELGWIQDDDLWCRAFMAEEDAAHLMNLFNKVGFETEKGPESDFVMVNEFDRSMSPYCEWLNISEWDKGVIAWLAGTEPDKLIAREGWSPEKGSGLTFARVDDPNLEFLRLDGDVEVYLNKETGEEVFLARAIPNPDVVYATASKVILDNRIEPGQTPLNGEVAAEVRNAVTSLEDLLEHNEPTWRLYFCIGKGREALGDLGGAYEAMKLAHEADDEETELILRELGGMCLQLGSADEAVAVTEKAAAIQPDDPATLGNLACAYLIAARLDEAEATITAALKICLLYTSPSPRD